MIQALQTQAQAQPIAEHKGPILGRATALRLRLLHNGTYPLPAVLALLQHAPQAEQAQYIVHWHAIDLAHAVSRHCKGDAARLDQPEGLSA